MPRTAVRRAFPCRWFDWSGIACAVAVLLCGSPAADAVSLAIRVEKANGKPLSGAVLMLQPEGQRLAAPAPVHAIVDQVDLAFVPDLVVVPIGSTVSFPNSDAVSHQVYSFSSTRRFQLPLYRGKPYPPVTFDQPGVVTLGCNIHDNMLAYVVVTDASFFGRSDANGEWTVPELPDGRYRVRIWHPLLNEPMPDQAIEVRSPGQGAARIRLTKSLRPAPLSSRPHSWDY